jgi:pyridoxamine 5'-phosphate oxidase
MSAPLPPWHDDLPGSLAHAWATLVRGAADRRHAFHTPSVATIGEDGGPRVRAVVLRGVEPATRTLRFHTDARSAKARELVADPRIAIHAYDAGAKLQLRLEGQATLHRHDAVAEAAWAATRPFSRACYRVATAPGTPADDPLSALTEAGEGEEAGREAFVAVGDAAPRRLWPPALGVRLARRCAGRDVACSVIQMTRIRHGRARAAAPVSRNGGRRAAWR